MAYSTISKPSLYFNTKLYTGNGSTNAITGVGFQPDWTWLKRRDTADSHALYDAVRGVTKRLETNNTSAEGTKSAGLTTFGTDGFTLGSDTQANTSGGTHASWNWKAGTTSGLTTNGTTTITPTSYSFNSTAGFSILKYTGNGAAGAYVAHGLGTAPAMIIVKKTSGTAGWFVYHQKVQSTYNLYLNTNDAEFGGAYVYSPDATNFRLRDHNDVNQNGETYVAYCFAEKKGYSKFGSYTGNGNADGTFVYTGFKPAWVMIKKFNSTSNWSILDNKRLGFNSSVSPREVYANSNDQEYDSNRFDIISNGFKLRTSGGDGNANGSTYIYMTFAEEPLVANVGASIPATAI